MKHAFAAGLMLAIVAPTCGFAVTPVSVVKGPPASVKMEVHDFGVNEIYLTLPARDMPYGAGTLKITLLRGTVPAIFQVDLAYKELPDGRIYVRVDIPKEEQSSYAIRVWEMTSTSTWFELFSGKLSAIPSEYRQ